MWILIDDVRIFGVDIIARNGKAGLYILHSLSGLIDGAIIDHDLGDGINGHDVIKRALQDNCLPKRVQLCSMNPVGLKAMADTLRAAGYNGRETYFTRELSDLT